MSTETVTVEVKSVEVIDRPYPRWVLHGRGTRGAWEPSHREYQRKPRVYVWPEGESLLENLAFREDRPHRVYRRAAVPAALEALGLPPGTRVRWDRHAGCAMCPCSPGFVVDAPCQHRDVHVTVAGVEQPVTERVLERATAVMSDPTLAPLLVRQAGEEAES